MKRTQLYIDDEIYSILLTISKQKKKTVSHLVREAIAEKYGRKEKVDRLYIAKNVSGVWKNRKDLSHVDRYLKNLRRDTRRKRFGIE
jgi:predicted DNA-binding protein